jgi:dCMP deaminase
VVCEKKYHAGAESEEMFAKAGVQLEFFSEEVLMYK